MSIAPINTSDAERRALKIGLRLDTIADNYEAVMPMIREALEEGDHATLGYRSPGEYLADRFGKALSRLPVIVRREFVGELTDAGLSTRAIAAVTGTSHETARKDQMAGVNTLTPEPAALTDEPGRVMKLTGAGSASDYRETVNTETGEVSDDYLSDDATGEEVTSSAEAFPTGGAVRADDAEGAPGEEVEPTSQNTTAPSRPAVTGLDGKTYKPRDRKAAPRKPLLDSFTAKRWEMQKALESLSRLTADDRFPQNAEKVATANRSDLIRIKDQLELVIEQLPEHI